MDSIRLHEFARLGRSWSAWVIWAYALLAGTIEAVVAAEYPPHTAQRYLYA